MSAWTPAFINRESSFISRLKRLVQDDMWCGQSHFHILSLIELLANNQKKQRQECLTSDNNNSTIADLPKKNVAKTIMFNLLDLI